MCSLVQRLYNVPCYGSLNDRCEVISDGYCPPWSCSRKGYSWLDRTVTVVFLRHRIFYLIAVVFVIFNEPAVAKTRSAVASVYSCLADEHPSFFTYLEEAREGISMSMLRLLGQRLCDCIMLLIARCGTLPSSHCMALRGEV